MDVSNANASTPGNMNFSPVGRPFVDPPGFLDGPPSVMYDGPGLIQQTNKVQLVKPTKALGLWQRECLRHGRQSDGGGRNGPGRLFDPSHDGQRVVETPSSPVIPASCSQLINFTYGAIVAGGLNLVEQNALINAGAQEGFDPLQFGIATVLGAASRGGWMRTGASVAIHRFARGVALSVSIN